LKENEVNETLENTIKVLKPLGYCLKILRKKYATPPSNMEKEGGANIE